MGTDAAAQADDAGSTGSALLLVTANGAAQDNIVTAAVSRTLRPGGTATGELVLFGGTQIVEDSGVSYDPVFRGGTLDVDGEVLYGATASSPASAAIDILSGTGLIAQFGSGIVTLSGNADAFDGTIALASGTVEIGTAANLGAGVAIDFARDLDPTLQIDASINALPKATISGYDPSVDIIDLRGLSFSANDATTPYSSYALASISTGGGKTGLHLVSGGKSGALTLDPDSTVSGPLDLYADGAGGTVVSASFLAAASVSDLDADFDRAATLSNGTYTVFLTGDVTLANADGSPASIDPIQATQRRHDRARRRGAQHLPRNRRLIHPVRRHGTGRGDQPRRPRQPGGGERRPPDRDVQQLRGHGRYRWRHPRAGGPGGRRHGQHHVRPEQRGQRNAGGRLGGQHQLVRQRADRFRLRGRAIHRPGRLHLQRRHDLGQLRRHHAVGDEWRQDHFIRPGGRGRAVQQLRRRPRRLPRRGRPG